MGLINSKFYEELVQSEMEIERLLEKEDLYPALNSWQNEMSMIRNNLKLINSYDFTRSRSDVSEQNFWHFLQKPHVRNAIHVGNTFFDGGSRVLDR